MKKKSTQKMKNNIRIGNWYRASTFLLIKSVIPQVLRRNKGSPIVAQARQKVAQSQPNLTIVVAQRSQQVAQEFQYIRQTSKRDFSYLRFVESHQRYEIYPLIFAESIGILGLPIVNVGLRLLSSWATVGLPIVKLGLRLGYPSFL